MISAAPVCPVSSGSSPKVLNPRPQLVSRSMLTNGSSTTSWPRSRAVATDHDAVGLRVLLAEGRRDTHRGGHAGRVLPGDDTGRAVAELERRNARAAGCREGSRPDTACPAVTASASPSISVSFSSSVICASSGRPAGRRSPSGRRTASRPLRRGCSPRLPPQRRRPRQRAPAAPARRVIRLGVDRGPSPVLSSSARRATWPVTANLVLLGRKTGRQPEPGKISRTLERSSKTHLSLAERCLFGEITKAVATRYIGAVCAVNRR